MPRTRGFAATIMSFRSSHIRWVYDLTIIHNSKRAFQDAPSLVRIHSRSLSPEYQFHIHVKKYWLDDLPDSEDGIRKWVMDRFLEKDAYLAEKEVEWQLQNNHEGDSD